MKNQIIAIAVMSVLSIVVIKPAFSAGKSTEPLTVNIKRMSFDTALRIGKAAIEKCRKEGVQITVTVVDRGGHAQVVLRDTLAMDVSIPISHKKAYTAMQFNSPTSALETRFPGAYGVPKLDSLLMSAGGIPINIGGNIMGGIGVSGAPSGVTDEACATAGLAAVQDDLEMN
ncbi:MAG: adenosylcobalamin biosynthesis, GlcG-related protein [Gallionellales bacterium 35-53-114]|nr:MAG: adenosylcobalamin biosynthesis, GlcG-related protein [Gallionellales bacterium 35-53-114]OYZ65488.1 MAG: adenosylcobalamin biosynthesis, GlcG-related protein [Gallionellales bacterium 24-53-125]OZB08396.1 MAG: adenosylcobalamin biosynthesis, GlcG-related protein [Gallionellales bacterium 39-52-133]HQS58070.1 heme-binding protein [Gallionellaceae bacterium]HQS73625.1 heme-binding protein [Gallionellaceae bacterium]